MTEHGFEANVQIDDFRIERRLAAGGMGIVYRAWQLSHNRVVALKVLGSALTRPQNIARFQRETRIAARLDHPSIAKVYYVGQDEHLCYMAMELIDGITLRQLLDVLAATKSPNLELATLFDQPATVDTHAPTVRFDDPTAQLTADVSIEHTGGDLQTLTDEAIALIATEPYVRRICEIIRDAAVALDYAQRNGVVHRDIKPNNLMLDRAGKVHVIDFGVARFFEDATMTVTGQLVGTPLYMSPEQVIGRIEVDHRTDIYSLGIVLYELLTLRPPVTGATRDAVLRQITTKAMPPVGWLNPGVAKAIEGIVHKAIAKDPDERYQTAGDLADDLQHYLDGAPVQAQHYHYKLDPREVLAERPPQVIGAAFALLFIAAVHTVLLLIVISRRAPNWPQVLLYGAVIVTACCSGVGLFSGRRWARWLAIAVAVTALAVAARSIINFLSILPGPNLGPVLATVAPFLAPLVFVLPAGALVIYVVLQRSTLDWVQFANRLRAEHRRIEHTQ